MGRPKGGKNKYWSKEEKLKLVKEHLEQHVSTLEMDFFIRNSESLIPVEVKANDNPTISLNNLTNGNYKDIKFGIKLCNKNIGWNGRFYTFPYFMTFLLKRFLKEKE